MALPESKIMEIIEKQGHITLKPENSPLRKRLWSMAEKGLIECADEFKGYTYWRKKGSDWRFFDKGDPRY